MVRNYIEDVAEQIAQRIGMLENGDPMPQCGCLANGLVDDPFKSCAVWDPFIFHLLLNNNHFGDVDDMKNLFLEISERSGKTSKEWKEFFEAYLAHELDMHKDDVKGKKLSPMWNEKLELSKRVEFD